MHSPVFNTRIYGQPSAVFKPRHMYKGAPQSLATHFGTKWTSTLRDNWRTFITDLNTDIGNYPTHAEAITLGKGVVGFNSGLTPLQFANSLALMGLVQRPTIESLA